MAAQSGTWDEDPQGVSLLLATGRVRHDLLVIAEPALLTELDEAWGRPASRVRLSFLPGVRAPGGAGQEDALVIYEKDGLGVFIADGPGGRGQVPIGVTAAARVSVGRPAAGGPAAQKGGRRVSFTLHAAPLSFRSVAMTPFPGRAGAATHPKVTHRPPFSPCRLLWNRLLKLAFVRGTGNVTQNHAAQGQVNAFNPGFRYRCAGKVVHNFSPDMMTSKKK